MKYKIMKTTKFLLKKDPKPYVYQEMTTTSSTIYVTVYQKISANI